MTQAQIRCFLEIAECGSFSKAAARMFISQPAVSKQLRLLESDLKLPLIDRSSPTLRLTEAGALFYDFFKRYTVELRQVREQAEKLARNGEDELNVGCLDGWDISAFYPELQSVLEEIGPGRTLKLYGYNHVQLVEALASGEIDLALGLDISLRRSAEHSVRSFFSVPLVLLLSRQHPLAGKEDLCLRDLRGEPIYVIAPASDCENAMEELITAACREAGFSPRIEHVPSSAAALMRLQGGVGAQLTSAMTGACRLPFYRAVVLTRMLDISVAWADNGRKPVKLAFIEELCRHYTAQETEP